jgi:type IV secretory pathway component VirB8
MRLDDLFDQEQNRGRRDYDSRYGNDDRYRRDDYSQPSQSFGQPDDLKQQILDKLRDNPQLKTLLIVGAVIIVVVLVVAVILLLPLIMKLIGYIGDNGIQGIINSVWKGSK